METLRFGPYAAALFGANGEILGQHGRRWGGGKQEASNLWHSWKIDALEGCTASATEQKLLQSLEANLKSQLAVMENTVIHHAEQEDLREQNCESMSAILRGNRSSKFPMQQGGR